MENEKILGEMLTDEQLDGVAGGTADETRNDGAFFKAIGLTAEIPQNNEALKTIWAKLGVSVIVHDGIKHGNETEEYANSFNEYFIAGNQVSREKALKQALKKTKSKINLVNFL